MRSPDGRDEAQQPLVSHRLWRAVQNLFLCSIRSGRFESVRSAKNLERLSKKQSNNQATDQSGTVDFCSAPSVTL
jgi:hypothetical protein